MSNLVRSLVSSPRSTRLAAPLVLLAVLLGSVFAQSPAVLAPPSVAGLKVLLTNDDGVQPGGGAGGIFELRKALCAAGADVAVVAPWLDRSGAGTSITYGSDQTRFTLTTPELDAEYAGDCADAPSGGPVWGACVVSVDDLTACAPTSTSLTPADSATLGIAAAAPFLLGWEAGPDLVISGINRGGNDGTNVNISGTLGAATVAASLGHSTMAINTSSSGNAANNFRAAAEWAVTFVGTLAANDLLPVDYVINVNYPRTDREPITRAAWASVAQLSPFATGFKQNEGEDPLHFESTFAFCELGSKCGDPEEGSDSALYGSGVIAVSPVSVDRTVGAQADVEAVRALVESGAVNPR